MGTSTAELLGQSAALSINREQALRSTIRYFDDNLYNMQCRHDVEEKPAEGEVGGKHDHSLDTMEQKLRVQFYQGNDCVSLYDIYADLNDASDFYDFSDNTLGLNRFLGNQEVIPPIMASVLYEHFAPVE